MEVTTNITDTENYIPQEQWALHPIHQVIPQLCNNLSWSNFWPYKENHAKSKKQDRSHGIDRSKILTPRTSDKFNANYLNAPEGEKREAKSDLQFFLDLIGEGLLTCEAALKDIAIEEKVNGQGRAMSLDTNLMKLTKKSVDDGKGIQIDDSAFPNLEGNDFTLYRALLHNQELYKQKALNENFIVITIGVDGKLRIPEIVNFQNSQEIQCMPPALSSLIMILNDTSLGVDYSDIVSPDYFINNFKYDSQTLDLLQKCLLRCFDTLAVNTDEVVECADLNSKYYEEYQDPLKRFKLSKMVFDKFTNRCRIGQPGNYRPSNNVREQVSSSIEYTLKSIFELIGEKIPQEVTPAKNTPSYPEQVNVIAQYGQFDSKEFSVDFDEINILLDAVRDMKFYHQGDLLFWRTKDSTIDSTQAEEYSKLTDTILKIRSEIQNIRTKYLVSNVSAKLAVNQIDEKIKEANGQLYEALGPKFYLALKL